MAIAPSLAVPLLQAGLFTGCVLVVQFLAVRRLSVETIPQVLRARVALSTRLRPWLLAAATTMVAVGLLLQTSYE